MDPWEELHIKALNDSCCLCGPKGLAYYIEHVASKLCGPKGLASIFVVIKICQPYGCGTCMAVRFKIRQPHFVGVALHECKYFNVFLDCVLELLVVSLLFFLYGIEHLEH